MEEPEDDDEALQRDVLTEIGIEFECCREES
jgi:hypothetical protein